jgi:hypothetical protein
MRMRGEARMIKNEGKKENKRKIRAINNEIINKEGNTCTD